MIYEFVLPFPYVTGNTAHFGNHKLKPRTKKYYLDTKIVLKALEEPMTGLLSLTLHIIKPDHRKYDRDNLEKIIYDALVRAKVIIDDSNIVTGSTNFCGIKKPGLILGTIYEIC